MTRADEDIVRGFWGEDVASQLDNTVSSMNLTLMHFILIALVFFTYDSYRPYIYKIYYIWLQSNQTYMATDALPCGLGMHAHAGGG